MNSELAMIDSEAKRLSESPQGEPSAPSAWSDWVGVVASIGCAIHCAAMPFVIAYLPALGLSFLADEAFHQWMAGACFLIALTAFVPGLRKHRRPGPVLIASVGLAMISVAAFGFAGECCPSCAGDAAVNGDAADKSVALAAADDLATCTDANCPHCESESLAASSEVAASSPASLAASPLAPPSLSSSPWSARIAPWLTPLGGIVLVSAHLLNRRYGCQCGCCGVESSDEAIG
ncbi:MAG: MerC domain-containing protein [Planctomycetota bacterium]